MKSAQELWVAALGELQLQVSRPNFNTWLKNTVGISYKNNIFIIGVPNAFVAEWLKNRLCSLVEKTLVGITGKNMAVQFNVQVPEGSDAQPAYANQADGGTATRIPIKMPAACRLNNKYTFDNFVTGEANRLAFAAALEVAENPGSVYNPLFIYGGTGLGKTHLLQAIGHTARANGYRILYTSAEQLTNEFVSSLKNNTTEAFQSKFRSVDFLLLDDFQFLSGKAQTQECFFHTFNELHDNNCQIVTTCDRPPKSIHSLGEKLLSRLQWGLIADMRPPDFETRLSILENRIKKNELTVPVEVLQFIAMQFRHNIRELEGGLNRVATFAKLSGNCIDMNVTKLALAVLVEGNAGDNSTPEPRIILETVAGYYGLSTESLIGKLRDRKTALARHIAMYLIREHGQYRLLDIGDMLGGRDHTTVLHGCDKIARESKTVPHVEKAINEIRKELGIKKQ
jgi:chromosomal replication initiator protein